MYSTFTVKTNLHLKDQCHKILDRSLANKNLPRALKRIRGNCVSACIVHSYADTVSVYSWKLCVCIVHSYADTVSAYKRCIDFTLKGWCHEIFN